MQPKATACHHSRHKDIAPNVILPLASRSSTEKDDKHSAKKIGPTNSALMPRYPWAKRRPIPFNIDNCRNRNRKSSSHTLPQATGAGGANPASSLGLPSGTPRSFHVSTLPGKAFSIQFTPVNLFRGMVEHPSPALGVGFLDIRPRSTSPTVLVIYYHTAYPTTAPK